MGYEYLYDRCMRLSFDTDNRAIFTGSDEYSPADDPSSIKSYLDKTDAANANVLAAMNGGAEVADNQSIVLDRMRGFIEVPNAWNQFKYYDFGFELTFSTNGAGETQETASVAFTNTYANPVVPPAEPANPASPENPGSHEGDSSTKRLPQAGDPTDLAPIVALAGAALLALSLSIARRARVRN